MEPRNPMYSSYNPNALGGKRVNPVEPTSRRLIRPSLTEYKEPPHAQRPPQDEHRPHGQGPHRQGPPLKQKRPVPPEQTNAENFYYVKQMQARTPMVVVLNDGEELHGVIEWYDRTCIKVNRVQGPNVLVYKSNVKYLYKESDKDGAGVEAEAEGNESA